MLKPSAIAVALGIFLSVGCSTQPSDRPRDGSDPVPIGQGISEAVETPEPGSVTDVSIRFIDEDGATATPLPTVAPSAEPSVTPNPSGPIPPQAAASPGSLDGRTPGSAHCRNRSSRCPAPRESVGSIQHRRRRGRRSSRGSRRRAGRERWGKLDSCPGRCETGLGTGPISGAAGHSRGAGSISSRIPRVAHRFCYPAYRWCRRERPRVPLYVGPGAGQLAGGKHGAVGRTSCLC